MTFQEIRPEERTRLFEFYAAHLPAADRIRTLYTWRLSDAASSGGIRTLVAMSGSAIVAATSVVPLQVGLGGARLGAAWQQDTVVAEGHRGSGIGRRLVEMSAEGYPLVTSKGTLPPMYALKKRMGFIDVPRSNYLLRVLAPVAASGSVRKRLGLPLLYGISKLRRVDHRRSPVPTRTVTHFDSDFDSLCARITRGSEVSPVKDSGYLNWRYARCPVRSYWIIQADDPGGGVRGGAVVRPNPAPYTDAWLVDMIVEVDDRETQHALLNACFRQLRRSRASCLRTFATSPRIRLLLKERGFMETADSPRFTFRFASPNPEFQASAWNFWHGDADTELLD